MITNTGKDKELSILLNWNTVKINQAKIFKDNLYNYNAICQLVFIFLQIHFHKSIKQKYGLVACPTAEQNININ